MRQLSSDTQRIVGADWRRDQFSTDGDVIDTQQTVTRSLSDTQRIEDAIGILYSTNCLRHYRYPIALFGSTWYSTNRRRRNRYLILSNSLASRSAGRIHSILNESETQLIQYCWRQRCNQVLILNNLARGASGSVGRRRNQYSRNCPRSIHQYGAYSTNPLGVLQDNGGRATETRLIFDTQQ